MEVPWCFSSPYFSVLGRNVMSSHARDSSHTWGRVHVWWGVVLLCAYLCSAAAPIGSVFGTTTARSQYVPHNNRAPDYVILTATSRQPPASWARTFCSVCPISKSVSKTYYIHTKRPRVWGRFWHRGDIWSKMRMKMTEIFVFRIFFAFLISDSK